MKVKVIKCHTCDSYYVGVVCYYIWNSQSSIRQMIVLGSTIRPFQVRAALKSLCVLPVSYYRTETNRDQRAIRI